MKSLTICTYKEENMKQNRLIDRKYTTTYFVRAQVVLMNQFIRKLMFQFIDSYFDSIPEARKVSFSSWVIKGSLIGISII